mgnify:CR=1 FL=1
MSLPIITAQADRFLELEKQILGAQPAIEHWLRSQWVGACGPVLCLGGSAQQRLQAGPGGHQPVSRRLQQPQPRVPAAVRAGGDDRAGESLPRRARRSAHPRRTTPATRSTCRTWRCCKNILRRAGMKVRIGTLIPEITAPTEITLPDGGTLLLEPLVRKGKPPRRWTGSIPAWCCSTTTSRRASPEILENLEQAGASRRCTPAGPRDSSRTTSPPTSRSRRSSRKRDRHRPLAGESVFRCLRRDPASRRARARIASRAT